MATTFSQNEVNALATELLMLQNDAEIDNFFGDLLKKAVGGVKQFAGSQLGQTLTSGLKAVAKQALPQLGAAVGNMIVPGAGGAIGSRLASAAASRMEYEGDNEENFLGDVLNAVGLEAQDSEQDGFLGDILGAAGLEVEAPMAAAKQVVRVADAATQNIKRAPRGADIRVVVRKAIMDAIKQYAPTLLSGGACKHGRSDGRWFRRGNQIVLVGA
jgi:uncharacterized protein (DUF697 family)